MQMSRKRRAGECDPNDKVVEASANLPLLCPASLEFSLLRRLEAIYESRARPLSDDVHQLLAFLSARQPNATVPWILAKSGAPLERSVAQLVLGDVATDEMHGRHISNDAASLLLSILRAFGEVDFVTALNQPIGLESDDQCPLIACIKRHNVGLLSALLISPELDVFRFDGDESVINVALDARLGERNLSLLVRRIVSERFADGWLNHDDDDDNDDKHPLVKAASVHSDYAFRVILSECVALDGTGMRLIGAKFRKARGVWYALIPYISRVHPGHRLALQAKVAEIETWCRAVGHLMHQEVINRLGVASLWPLFQDYIFHPSLFFLMPDSQRPVAAAAIAAPL